MDQIGAEFSSHMLLSGDAADRQRVDKILLEFVKGVIDKTAGSTGLPVRCRVEHVMSPMYTAPLSCLQNDSVDVLPFIRDAVAGVVEELCRRDHRGILASHATYHRYAQDGKFICYAEVYIVTPDPVDEATGSEKSEAQQ
jgi:hypothetical protein